MIFSLAVILTFQLLGEIAQNLFGLPLPGPVIGLAGLLLAMICAPTLAAKVIPTAQSLLSHLSLLFVPASVGVISHIGTLGHAGPALMLALVVSTALAIAVGAATFVALAKLTGNTAGTSE